MTSRNHSETLNLFFPISPIGIDYTNDYKVKIEFKETFSLKPVSKIRIKIRNSQLDNSDLLVICFNDSIFYIHKTKNLRKYKQNTKDNRTTIRFTTLQKNYYRKIYKWINLQNLLDYYCKFDIYGYCQNSCQNCKYNNNLLKTQSEIKILNTLRKPKEVDG